MHEKAKRTTQNLDTTPGLIQQDVESNYENNRKQFEKYRSAQEQMDAYSQRRSYSTLLLKQSQNKAGLATQRDESMFQYGNKNSRLEKSNRDQLSDIQGSQQRHQSVLLQEISENNGLRKSKNMRSKSNFLKSPSRKHDLGKTSQNQS